MKKYLPDNKRITKKFKSAEDAIEVSSSDSHPQQSPTDTDKEIYCRLNIKDKRV